MTVLQPYMLYLKCSALNLSIDKTFYPMRQQIDFQQYSSLKPNKCGLLLKSLNDVPLFSILTKPLFMLVNQKNG